MEDKKLTFAEMQKIAKDYKSLADAREERAKDLCEKRKSARMECLRVALVTPEAQELLGFMFGEKMAKNLLDRRHGAIGMFLDYDVPSIEFEVVYRTFDQEEKVYPEQEDYDQADKELGIN